jgi:hypothetical protein
MIKKLLVCLLSSMLLLSSLVSCTSEETPVPYSAEVLYQTDGYAPTVSYLLNQSEYDTSGYPTFMGMPLYAKYLPEYLVIHSDLTMEYYDGKKPKESVLECYAYQNDAPNGPPSDTNPQPLTYNEFLQSLQATKIPEIYEMFDEEDEKIHIRHVYDSGAGFSVVFAQDWNKSPTYVAELDENKACLRIIKIHKLNVFSIRGVGVDVNKEAA